jgi:phage tail protein X
MTADLTETITVEGDFITVPLIVWRRFKRPMPGLVETIFDTNPGLADLGHYLPVGTVFTMPIPTPREPVILEPIKLW